MRGISQSRYLTATADTTQTTFQFSPSDEERLDISTLIEAGLVREKVDKTLEDMSTQLELSGEEFNAT